MSSIFDRIPFTKQDKENFSQLNTLSAVYALHLDDPEHVMKRQNTFSIPTTSGDIDTFVIYTSADPEKIQYTADDNFVYMADLIDGGEI
jgi:hypothetical protein